MSQTVFITGCSSGIGRAAALRFAASGWNVVATARRLEDIASLQAPNLAVTTCDVTDNASVTAAIGVALTRFQSLDVVINNAGYAHIGLVESTPLDAAQQQLAVNTFGVIRVVQAALPALRARQGRIINISSIAGRTLVPLGGWYSASKFALEALNDALRFECAPQGIHVISILPGPVLSDFMDKLHVTPLSADAPELHRAYLRHYEQRRKRKRPFAVTPEQVAALIVKAANTSHPRARYFITVPARTFNFSKKFVPDKLWDRLTKRAYGFDKVDAALRTIGAAR